MADGAWYFYACPFCGELVKTARDADGVDGVNSIGFLWFSRSRFLGASAGASCLSSILIACLVDDVVPSSYSVPPMSAPSWIHAPLSVYHAASFLCLPDLPYRLVFLIAFPRFASHPAPRVVERGDVILRALAACFPCPCDVVLGWRRERAAYFVESAVSMWCVDSGA